MSPVLCLPRGRATWGGSAVGAKQRDLNRGLWRAERSTAVRPVT